MDWSGGRRHGRTLHAGEIASHKGLVCPVLASLSFTLGSFSLPLSLTLSVSLSPFLSLSSSLPFGSPANESRYVHQGIVRVLPFQNWACSRRRSRERLWEESANPERACASGARSLMMDHRAKFYFSYVLFIWHAAVDTYRGW